MNLNLNPHISLILLIKLVFKVIFSYRLSYVNSVIGSCAIMRRHSFAIVAKELGFKRIDL